MTLQNFKLPMQPIIRYENYWDIFTYFHWDTWFFHYWAPYRKWNDPPNKRWIGICVFGRCMFLAVWVDIIN